MPCYGLRYIKIALLETVAMFNLPIGHYESMTLDVIIQMLGHRTGNNHGPGTSIMLGLTTKRRFNPKYPR
jgi:hypothetical protein